MKKLLLSFSLVLSVFCCLGQNQYLFHTPSQQIPYSTFNDVGLWLRSDNISGSPNGYTFVDKSTNANNMVQQSGTSSTGTGANGQTKIVLGSSATFNSNFLVNNFPSTVIIVAKRTSAVSCGLFGHTDFATLAQDLWFGFENVTGFETLYTYGPNFTANDLTEVGNVACYISRNGYGSRGQIVNGLLQSNNTLSNQVKTTKACSIGTTYKGANSIEWYETLIWNRALTFDDLDEIYSYLNTRYAMSLPLWGSLTPVVTATKNGQSNSAGRGARGAADVNVPAIYQGALTNVNIYNPSLTPFPQTLNIQNNNHMYPESNFSYMGDEEALGYQYVNRTGNPIHIFKFSQGSTSLGHRGGNNGDWLPTISLNGQNADHVPYNGYMRGWWNTLVTMQTNGIRPNIRGIDWFQGEDDALDATLAANYQANLTTLINEMRAEMGFTAAQAPFYIVRLPSWQLGGETYLSTIRTAQSNVSSTVSNCVLIDTDWSTDIGDKIHLDLTSQITLGTNIAATF